MHAIDPLNIVGKGIISPAELHEIMQDPQGSKSLKVLDATFVLPNSNIDPKSNFSNSHINQAQFFDIEAISEPNVSLPHMLPSAELFEQAVSGLGIKNSDMVVVYGQSGLIMGPARVWWMFRYFGHNNICVLDGGLPAWINAGYETTDQPTTDVIKTNFKAVAYHHLLSNKEQVKTASKNKTAVIMDARPQSRFNGEDPEPRKGVQPGHIVNSINIPASQLVNPDTGCLKPDDELKQIFEPHLKTNTPIITTCGSGITACVIALALFNIGTKNASVYDGSWAEYGQEPL